MFEDVALGSRTEHAHVVTEEDVARYAELTGDYNPVHVDEEYARTTRYGARVAHGLLTCGLVQKSLTELVAPGGVSLSYEFHLRRPVFLGDTVVARGRGCAEESFGKEPGSVQPELYERERRDGGGG